MAKFHKIHFQHDIATSGSSEGNEMTESMWSHFLFCIFDDFAMMTGSVISSIPTCHLNYFLDVTCLFKKYKSLVNHLIY